MNYAKLARKEDLTEKEESDLEKAFNVNYSDFINYVTNAFNNELFVVYILKEEICEYDDYNSYYVTDCYFFDKKYFKKLQEEGYIFFIENEYFVDFRNTLIRYAEDGLRNSAVLKIRKTISCMSSTNFDYKTIPYEFEKPENIEIFDSFLTKVNERFCLKVIDKNYVSQETINKLCISYIENTINHEKNKKYLQFLKKLSNDLKEGKELNKKQKEYLFNFVNNEINDFEEYRNIQKILKK